MDTISRQIEKACWDKGYKRCPSCRATVRIGMLAWNSSSTEAGTDYSMVNCICDRCETNIFHFTSWYPGIDGMDELLDVIEDDLPAKEKKCSTQR